MEDEYKQDITTIFDAPGDDEQDPEDSVLGSKYEEVDA